MKIELSGFDDLFRTLSESLTEAARYLTPYAVNVQTDAHIVGDELTPDQLSAYIDARVFGKLRDPD